MQPIYTVCILQEGVPIYTTTTAAAATARTPRGARTSLCQGVLELLRQAGQEFDCVGNVRRLFGAEAFLRRNQKSSHAYVKIQPSHVVVAR